MTKHARILLLASAALVLVAVPTAFAKPTHTTATVAVTAGKPAEFGFKLSTKTVKHGAVTFSVTNGGAIPHVQDLLEGHDNCGEHVRGEDHVDAYARSEGDAELHVRKGRNVRVPL